MVSEKWQNPLVPLQIQSNYCFFPTSALEKCLVGMMTYSQCLVALEEVVTLSNRSLAGK